MRDIHDVFDAYDRRFLNAMLNMPRLDPSDKAQRAQIISKVRQCLAVRDEWIPQVDIHPVGKTECPGFNVQHLKATTWPGVNATALLYTPADMSENDRLAFVMVCCGHGVGCKLSPAYQKMCRRLARLGAIVLCVDNIGQGERVAMGHRDCTGAFQVGLSVQGLIVMEAMGWLEWARKHPNVDSGRIGCVGNSGGGMLTLFLSALVDNLAAVVSSGYPTSFDYVARKEKKHCHCNLLPGIVGQLEMHHVLGCFAPRPMLIAQGRDDHLFPQDLFAQTARRVGGVYERLGSADAFASAIAPGGHSWDAGRIELIGEFMRKWLTLPGNPGPVDDHEEVFSQERTCFERWPGDSSRADDIASQLTGKTHNASKRLWEIYPPDTSGLELPTPQGDECDWRQVFAQFELMLGTRAVPAR